MVKLEIQTDAKPFTMVKNAIIDSEDILNEHEKILYIVLLRYGNRAFPSLATLSKKCGFSKSTAQRTIDTLIEKGLLKKKNRINKNTGNTSNLYTLIDNDKIWCSTKENLKANIKAAILEEAVKIVEASGMKVSGKEKGLVSEPTKEQKQVTNNIDLYKNDDTPKQPKCQEKCTLEELKEFFDYEIMIADRPDRKEDIDSVISVLYDTINTTKDTIRVQGEPKPVAVVISKLMKLCHTDIFYAIEKFNEQTERIRNPTAYMLTLLYYAREQSTLDISNQVQHDMYHWEPPKE